jgi:hypothetical protein
MKSGGNVNLGIPNLIRVRANTLQVDKLRLNIVGVGLTKLALRNPPDMFQVGKMIPLCVITRTRNRSHLLKRALESLLSQTSQDFSWIIVDSSDIPAEAEKIAKLAKERLRDVRLIPSFGSAVGMEAASNIGIAAASSPYVTFLDDDDTWECEFVAQTMDFLQRNPAMAGVCVQSTMTEV